MGSKRAIKKTIEYANHFKSRIDRDEFFDRLISFKKYSRQEINKLTEGLPQAKKADKNYEKKYKKAVKIGKKIEKFFKNILFLGISGSVASGHPKKNDDIDFLIITRGNKLWETRFWLRWWIFKNQIPHREYGKKGKSDEVCFNLWLDEFSLLLPKNRRNIRSAVDLVLLKPLINRNKTYEKFILANNWAKKWVATPYINRTKDLRFKIQDLRIRQNSFDLFINNLYFWPQYGYMKKKIKKEQVGLHEAFFHEPMVK